MGINRPLFDKHIKYGANIKNRYDSRPILNTDIQSRQNKIDRYSVYFYDNGVIIPERRIEITHFRKEGNFPLITMKGSLVTHIGMDDQKYYFFKDKIYNREYLVLYLSDKVILEQSLDKEIDVAGKIHDKFFYLIDIVVIGELKKKNVNTRSK